MLYKEIKKFYILIKMKFKKVQNDSLEDRGKKKQKKRKRKMRGNKKNGIIYPNL